MKAELRAVMRVAAIGVIVTIGLLLGLCTDTAFAAGADGSPPISIVGSSTVYPFSARVAEHFAKSGPFPAPVVTASSTGEGFRLFCAGAAAGTPDIANASRSISADERSECARAGVAQIAEVRIGYDSLIVASKASSRAFSVTLDQLWRAAAKSVPINGAWAPNPYRSWRDIAASLPEQPIRLLGPAPGHGTRDAFIDLVMEPSCTAAMKASRAAPGLPRSGCDEVRADGAWVNVDDLELVLGKLANDADAMGILTYSYLEQFPTRIHAATVDGIAPGRAAISSGRYPISRPLFMYVKTAHIASTLGLADYVTEFVSLCAAGTHGYLADEGLVPMPLGELLAQRSIAARLQR